MAFKVKLNKVGAVIHRDRFITAEDKKHQKKLSRRGLRRTWRKYTSYIKKYSDFEAPYPTPTSLKKLAKGWAS